MQCLGFYALVLLWGCHATQAAIDVIKVDTRADYISQLASSRFQTQYWERGPVLFRTGSAFADVLPLSKVLNGHYRGPDDLALPHLYTLNGTLFNKDAMLKQLGWTKQARDRTWRNCER